MLARLALTSVAGYSRLRDQSQCPGRPAGAPGVSIYGAPRPSGLQYASHRESARYRIEVSEPTDNVLPVADVRPAACVCHSGSPDAPPARVRERVH